MRSRERDRLTLMHEMGACRDYEPEMFYPVKGQVAAQAKRVCAICPVRVTCLEYTLAAPEHFGVWGGLSEKELSRERARRTRSTKNRGLAHELAG